MQTQNIVILISGGGSNMAAIVQAAQQQQWRTRFNAHIAAVISNRPNAGGLQLAQAHHIPTAIIDHTQYASRTEFERALSTQIDQYQPSLVVLAGFMRILTAEFVAHYTGRILNIHPSLLPAFTGLNTHQRALDVGCKFAGATVHHVTQELDSGAILEQVVVPILPQDTAQTLAQRVLSQEHIMYPRAIAKWLQSQIKAQTT